MNGYAGGNISDYLYALQTAVESGWLTDDEARAEARRCFPTCERVDNARRVLAEVEED